MPCFVDMHNFARNALTLCPTYPLCPTLSRVLCWIATRICQVVHFVYSSESLLPFLQQLEEVERTLLVPMLDPDRCLHFMRPGRIVRVKQGGCFNIYFLYVLHVFNQRIGMHSMRPGRLWKVTSQAD